VSKVAPMWYSSSSRRKSGRFSRLSALIMTEHIGPAVKLPTAMDEWRKTDKSEIAAKIVIVQDRTDVGRMDCVRRRNPGRWGHIMS